MKNRQIKTKKEYFIVGTRPEIIKVAPILLKLDRSEYYLVHTGQHCELAVVMYNLFGITPDIDLNLMEENQTLESFLSKAIVELDKIVKKHDFKRIWVHGDTSTALAGAIVAFTNKIELVHNEAGLRSFDKNNPFPEEIFRTLIDRMSDILFAPTQRSVENLKKENISGRIHLVGNTIVDALEMMKDKLPKERPIKEKYVLATVHRRESFGNDIYEIFKALKELSKTIKVVIPAHPNPNVQKVIKDLEVETVQPMNYIDFLWHMRDCEYIISDSGGLQEEAPSFNKKIIVLRKTTERQEAIEKGYAILVPVLEKNFILDKIEEFISGDQIEMHNPFGNGKTTEKIIKILNL